MKNLGLTMAAIAGLALAGQTAQAVTLKVSAGYGTSLGVSYNDGTINKSGTFFTGEFNTTALNAPDLQGTFVTFCADFASAISWNTWYNFTPTQFGAVPASFMNPDWDAATTTIVGKRISSIYEAWLFDKGNNLANNNVEAAAAQLAIWETIYDFDQNNVSSFFDLSGGKFELTSDNAAVVTKAIEYGALGASSMNGVIFVHQSESSPQSLLYPTSDPYPGPDGGTTMLLMGLGMLGLEGLRRKVQK